MSGSEGDARGTNVDEKKRKRMISNRESARRSRMKKQKHMRDLVTEVASLKVEIHDNTKKCEVLMQKSVALELENDALKVRRMEVARYLRNLEVMQNHMELLQFNQAGGSLGDRIVDDINEAPKVESWKCRGSNQTAIMASSKMLNY